MLSEIRNAEMSQRPNPNTHLALLSDDHVRPLAEIEAEVIRFAIEYYDGHMSEVARRLDIGRSTLYRKLEGLGIPTKASADAYESA
jgi:DNA-binding NtrC family response regulator